VFRVIRSIRVTPSVSVASPSGSPVRPDASNSSVCPARATVVLFAFARTLRRLRDRRPAQPLPIRKGGIEPVGFYVQHESVRTIGRVLIADPHY
jgi:hypothetical protein